MLEWPRVDLQLLQMSPVVDEKGSARMFEIVEANVFDEPRAGNGRFEVTAIEIAVPQCPPF